MYLPEDLYGTPNALAPHYSRFKVEERLLLTGHSHQAWPDRGFEGQKQAWLDAALHVDEKWRFAFEEAEKVRLGYRRLLDDPEGHLSLAGSTHELVVRFLSALNLGERPKIVSTDGEFHSVRRQLDRLVEEGIEIVKVPSRPARDVSTRIAREIDSRTAAAIVSSVFFHTAHVVPGLEQIQFACQREGAELLIDAYHHLNVRPFSIRKEGLEASFVVGGGYKYCQLGEGVCFLRSPAECSLRPVVTGWFSEFGALTEAGAGGAVEYGAGGARFDGATYDPTSHYRAAAVFGFFAAKGLNPEFLCEVNRRQMQLLTQGFDDMDADPEVIDRDRSVPLQDTGGFLVLRTPRAEEFSKELHERGVSTDFRGNSLRLGPAPYLSDRQLRLALDALAEVLARPR